MLIGGGRLIE